LGISRALAGAAKGEGRKKGIGKTNLHAARQRGGKPEIIVSLARGCSGKA